MVPCSIYLIREINPPENVTSLLHCKQSTLSTLWQEKITDLGCINILIGLQCLRILYTEKKSVAETAPLQLRSRFENWLRIGKQLPKRSQNGSSFFLSVWLVANQIGQIFASTLVPKTAHQRTLSSDSTHTYICKNSCFT